MAGRSRIYENLNILTHKIHQSKYLPKLPKLEQTNKVNPTQ